MKDSAKTLDNIRKPYKSTDHRHPSLDLRDLVYPAQLHDKKFADKFVRIFILFSVLGLWSVQACAPSLGSSVSKPEPGGREPRISVTAAPTAAESVTPAQGKGPKKLIYYGWGIRDTQYVRDSWHQMEEMPFDGVGIIVAIDRQAWQKGKTGTDNQLGWQVMGPRAFREEEFRDAMADLKEAKWERFTDNFVNVSLSRKGLNWFDEPHWRIIVNNFGLLAKIAAEGGLKGLIIDPESKTGLFAYPSQRRQVDESFGKYQQMARQRGRQVMTAIATSFPKAVLLSLFGYTYPLDQLQRGKILQIGDYGLLPAFYDGLLDAMPTGVYLIDGYEQSYPFKERKQFIEGYNRIHQEALTLSAVPDIYREKVKAGFGLWIDYYKKPNYFTPEELQRASGDALEVSDGYVWIYSQNIRFFPPSGITASHLEAIATARRAMR